MSQAGPSPEPKPAPRLGSYLLVKQLGSGGMSSVFRAVHEDSGSVVAVKVLPRNLAKNITLLQRFIREAKSAEALDHPNIAAIYDRGFDQGRHYLVLEYVEGRDLHDRVRLDGPLGIEQAVGFIREVAEGLQYAASRGMIHRDVKPANLLMTPDGHAKIIDLGLALQTEDEDERVTRDGTTVGTVDYMAPEQARDSRQTSERSDIYSLGCTFYYLLTGSTPYPGGGLADKLARHYKAPIPDVRVIRPEVSESLSLLIRRMMEKKPERRYADYTQLIAALDALSDPNAKPAPVLDALIVDDDEDEEDGQGGEIVASKSGSGLARPGDSGNRRPPSVREILTAEIVEDDEDDDAREPSQPTELSLADLAALDAEGDVADRRRGKPRAVTPSRPEVPTIPSSTTLDDLFDEAEPVEGEATGYRRSSGAELPLRTWIAAGVLVGLAIAVVGFAVSMIVASVKPTPAEIATPPPRGEVSEPEPPEPPEPRGPISPRIAPSPKPVPALAKSTGNVASPSTSPPDPAPPLEEVEYPPDWSERFGPPSAQSVSSANVRSKVVVRRMIGAGDEPQASSLALALGRSEEVVEIADAGPFFEDNLQGTGRSKLIRARPGMGIRPTIKIEPTQLTDVKEQEAKFVVASRKLESLTLEGVDLVVDLRELPEQQPALFLCRGGELILRDCSITLINATSPRRSRFSIIRVEEGARPGRITLERSTIRGPIRTLLEVPAAHAEVILDRSLIVGEAGPLITIESADPSSRQFSFHRSLLASRGPVLEIPGRPSPLSIRALGSTFARIDGGAVPGFLHARVTTPGETRSLFQWQGEDNDFVGWPAWLTSGSESAIRINGLDGVRAACLGSDRSSRESPNPWPSNLAREDVGPADLRTLAPDRRATLDRVAVPHPRLGEVALGQVALLTIPRLSDSMIPPFVAPMPPNPIPMVINPNGPTPKVAPPRSLGPIERTFDVSAKPWSGDLGRFVAESIVEGATRLTIRVRGGGGVFACSPIRFPEGLSVAILGESSEGRNLPMPVFVPTAESSGRVMFDLRRGDLTLAHLAFSSEGGGRPKHWVHVEDSLLAIRHCRIRDLGGPGVEAAIAFVAAGTATIGSRIGPFLSAPGRPTALLKNSLIWTAGEAISAEVGRGAVGLDNCLIIAGGTAISLRSSRVAHDRFEADLALERCTIADDRTAIGLGPWPGDPNGPDRPWLISTRSCVFPRTQVGGAGGLLEADPEAMARGAVFWQSYLDALEVTRFLATTGPPPTSPPPADIKKGWIDVWGAEHSRNVRGPDPRRNDSVIRYKDKERPRPGKVTPGSLELDPKFHKDLGVNFKDLPPSPKS